MLPLQFHWDENRHELRTILSTTQGLNLHVELGLLQRIPLSRGKLSGQVRSYHRSELRTPW